MAFFFFVFGFVWRRECFIKALEIPLLLRSCHVKQLAPGLLAASPQSTLQLTYLNPKGNVKQPFYSIIEVT